MQLRAVADVAKELGVSPFTVRRLIAAGEIRATHIGARILVPTSELERVAADGCGKRRTRRARLSQDGGF